MANIILFVGLFAASLFSIFAYNPGNISKSAGFNEVDYVFWMIIVFSAIPAAVEFIRVQLRALQVWLAKLISREALRKAENR